MVLKVLRISASGLCTFEALLSDPRPYPAPGLEGGRPRATAKLKDNSKPWTGHLRSLDIAA